MSDSKTAGHIDLIDFGAVTPSSRLSCTERLVCEGFVVARCSVTPTPGALISTVQHTVAIHESAPAMMEWCLPTSEVKELSLVTANDLFINAAERPMFFHWQNAPTALIIAFEQWFVQRVARDAFNTGNVLLRTTLAIRDPVIEGMAVVWRKELAEHGAGGQLYAQHLATALAIHLLRTYGQEPMTPHPVTGGLTTWRLRQVTDYVVGHLNEDIAVNDLAKIAGLSVHYFSEAFKLSTGRSPYHYVIDQRIRRAKELLLETKQSITEIALDVGFASHSHFTDQFRSRTGATPSRYRRDHS